MAPTLSNDAILDQLRGGAAQFELVSSPVPSVSNLNSCVSVTHFLQNRCNSPFFARIGPSLGHSKASSSTKKLKHYSVQKVAGDGRCMFRALVKGMARNKGISFTPRQEREEADELRAAVKEVICDNHEEHNQYEEAVIAITVDEPLKRYCQRIGRSDFWGGESELLVLSKLCHQPIIVYIPENELNNGTGGSGFIPIAEYGIEYCKGSGKTQPQKVVRLLYSGRNHYDLLI